ncbi:MAG: hypothetical protein ACTSSA_15495 [Candidatus Freyarchaeota archaeon]
MVGRIFRTVECWNYTNTPQIEIVLISVDGKRLPEKGGLKVSVDTGFSGYLLLPRRYYRLFQLGELPEQEFRVFKTLMGDIVMRGARAILRIPAADLEFEVIVETPKFGRGKLLIGRKALNELCLLMNGREHAFCLCEPEG